MKEIKTEVEYYFCESGMFLGSREDYNDEEWDGIVDTSYIVPIGTPIPEVLKTGAEFEFEHQEVMEMLGMGDIPDAVKNQVNDKQIVQMEAIINSMTPHERRFPAVIKGARKRRISKGSGTEVQDVNRLLKQFTQMQKMMKQMKKKGGMMNMMRGMKGKMPPGMPF